MTVWTAVLLAGLASYLLRVVPLLLLSRVELPSRVSDALRDAAMAAMTVILVGAAAHAADAGASSPGPADPVAALGRVVGVLGGIAVALVLGRRGRSMPVVVVASLGVFAGSLAAARVVGLVVAAAQT